MIYEIAALRPPFQADNQMALAMKIKSGVIDPLPKQYSADLQKTISMMLNLDQNKRPSIEDLITIPQIGIRLRETKIKEHHRSLKRSEEEQKKKAEDLDKREEELKKREEEYEYKMAQLKQFEK